MSENQNGHRLERIVYHSASAATEEAFTAAAREVFGDLEVRHLDGESASEDVTALDRALLVIAHDDTGESIGTLRQLRATGWTSPALLLVSSETPEFEADLAELGPAAAFPAEGFAPEDVEVCVNALESIAFMAPIARSAGPVMEEAAAAGPATQEGGDAPAAAVAADEASPLDAASLASLEGEETALFQSLESLRTKRRQQVEALGKEARASQRRLETLKKRLAKTQENLSVEKRQRWEVVLDLRESQERVKEVEERLQRARDGETRRQKEIEALRIDLEQRTSAVGTLTRERDAAQQRFEQAQKGLEKKSDLSRARIEELREESERLREEHAKAVRESDDRIAGLELELEEARREATVKTTELAAMLAVRDTLEGQLEELRAAISLERDESASRVAWLEEESRQLRQGLEQVTQSEGGRVAELQRELSAAADALEKRTAELSKAIAASDGLEKDLHHARAQYAKDKEESQAWIGELEREIEQVRGELVTHGSQRQAEAEELRAEVEAARSALETARAEQAQSALALADAQGAKVLFERQLAELDGRAAKEREESQARIARLAEERDKLDARLRRSSAETGKVSDLQKELDTLLAELADKEEERVALRGARESLEREAEEARGALAQEKEEAAARLATLSAERSDLERQLQEARDHGQTLERQMASLRAEVVKLEVAREEDLERLRELGSQPAAGTQQRTDEIQQERDRFKRELDAMRLDAENTRRALADSDARLRKLQQEKASTRGEPREKAGDLAIQQLRAELGSLGD